ncbi:hypothetical protein AA0481_0559 [Acetobacter orientalis NRIC 0481]|nr:hypothetical protein AA0481_0559 [Acetobacter orientalis NRIC 0481]
MAHIDSVWIRRQNTQIYGVLATVLLAFSALAGAAILLGNNHPKTDQSGEFIVIGLTTIVGIAFTYLALNPKHYLRFRSTGGDSRTIECRDYAMIGPLKLAIERAIIARG